MNVWARVLEANHGLLNGSGKLSYFERRGFGRDVIQDAGVGFENGAFLYPCISKSGDLLGVHVKTEKRDDNYDAGEEKQAHKDARKLLEAGALEVRLVSWPPEAPNGADVNGRLVKDPAGSGAWAAAMIAGATPVATAADTGPRRAGEPDAYFPASPELPSWPALAPEALHGLPGDFVRAVEPITEADPVALLANFLVACGSHEPTHRHAFDYQCLRRSFESALHAWIIAKGSGAVADVSTVAAFSQPFF